MTIRHFTRRVAAGAAAGLLLTTLVCGGAATADEQSGDAVLATDTSTAPTMAAAASAPAAPAEPAPSAPSEPAPQDTSSAAPAAATPPPAPSPDAATVPPAATPTTNTAPVEPAADTADAAVVPSTPEGATDAAIAASPTVAIDVPAEPASGWFTSYVDIRITASDPDDAVASITYRTTNGQEVVSPGGSAVVQMFLEGRRTITAWATDAAGNVSAPQTREVNIDRSGPRVDSYSIPPGSILRQGASVQLTFGCSDDLSGLASCTTDGRLPGWLLDTSTVGEHAFDIVGVDKAGNRSVTEYRYRVSADGTAPRVTATVNGRTAESSDWAVSEHTSVSLSLEDDETPEQSMLIYRLGSGDWRTVAGQSATVPVTQDGVFDFTYDGYDGVGNPHGTTTITVRRDTVLPDISLEVSDASGAPVTDGASVTQGHQLQLRYECTDATSGVRYCNAPVASGTMLDTDHIGTHWVTVAAIDVAGHATREKFEYTVEAPEVPTDPTDPVDPFIPAEPSVPTAPAEGHATGASPQGAASAPGSNDGRLASTGPGALFPLGLACAALLSLGAVLSALRRRRASAL